MAAFDALHPDAVGEVDGRVQSREHWKVRRSYALKAFRLELGMLPSLGRNRIPQTVLHFGTNEQESGPFGSLQPLVRRRCVHVTADVVQVERHHADDVCSVEGAEETF